MSKAILKQHYFVSLPACDGAIYVGFNIFGRLKWQQTVKNLAANRTDQSG